MNRRALYLACGIPAGIVCFLLLTILFTPNDAVKGLLVRTAENAGYTLTLGGFGKAFPFGYRAASVELSNDKGPLVKLRDARVRLKLLPLLIGKPQLGYSGGIGAGELEGEVTLGKSGAFSIQARRIRLEEIPYFTTVAGAKVQGELRLSGDMATVKGVPQGELQLQVRGAELAAVKLGAMPLPDAAYRDVRGALKIEQGRAVLKSFTLDGDGIYVRLKGDSALTNPVGNSPLNLSLEMMPKPAFLERQKLIFLLLMKYQSSPGAFSVPVRGTLAHPAVI